MPQKLLIVEDEETLRESLKRVFIRDGYEVDGVDSSEAALETIKNSSYDLVITDIVLPGINGIALLKRCRENNPDLKVIIMTAFASIETAVEAIRAGAYDYMVKPVQHDQIKNAVKKALTEPG
ncbi:MAG: sigma-54-dependent Fis family transcriptional regulator [Nitrospirae bacterium]|nr:MAG: sigma-54-dependent Fis family transcriptional regulator [Nitrospirota bacterium]